MEPLKTNDLNLALFRAIDDYDLDKIANLFQQGVDINKVHDVHDKTPFEYLLWSKSFLEPDNNILIDFLKLFVKNGADLNRLDRLGYARLSCYARLNDIIRLKTLLDLGADINFKDKYKKSALIYAIEKRNSESVNLLLDHGADYKHAISHFRKHYSYLTCHYLGNKNKSSIAYKNEELVFYADDKKFDIVNILIKAGAHINTINKSGQTPLMLAASNLDIEAVKTFLKYGANINIKDFDGKTALSLALENAYYADECKKADAFEISNLLIDAGSEVCNGDMLRAINSRNHHIYYSIPDKEIEIYDRLVSLGANVNETNDKDETPLMHAARQKDAKAIQFLMIYGADINAEDKMGKSALSYALSSNGCFVEELDHIDEVAILLMDKGINVVKGDLIRVIMSRGYYLDNDGKEKINVYKRLKSSAKGINNIDETNEHNQTPLMLSAFNNDIGVFQCLLKAGANIGALDNENKTVFDYAKDKLATILNSYTEDQHLSSNFDPDLDEYPIAGPFD